MGLQEFVDSLQLPFEGEMQGNEYVIEVETSDDFSNLFNAIDINKNLKIIDDQIATDKETRFRFTDGYYEINLTADYDKDDYRCTIEER